MNINIQNGDCLELMKNIPDESVDLIFCDPPYALGSEVIIKPDGKPEYKKAVDFMNKWDQPDGTFWEEWFIEAKRVLKHGGHCLMFGMDMDREAVEIAKLSLCLKVLEGENNGTIDEEKLKHGEPALPTLSENIKAGNSLLDAKQNGNMFFAENEKEYKLKPFIWSEEFDKVFKPKLDIEKLEKVRKLKEILKKVNLTKN